MHRYDLTLIQEKDLLIRKAKESLKLRRMDSKASLKDLGVVLICYVRGEYSEAFKTRLYNKHGGEYCELLEVLSNLNDNGELARLKSVYRKGY